jgi:hypothetical protein
MIFKHTSREKGLWRGWFADGQSVEVCWDRDGWVFASVFYVSSDDDEGARRLLNLSFWRLSVWLPMGFSKRQVKPFEGPRWGFSASGEFGLVFYCGQRRKSFDWPWDLHTLAYETQLVDGSWAKQNSRDAEAKAATEKHAYTYTLRSGEVQHRTATISRQRHIITWRAFKAIGKPRWIKEGIDIEFDGEVGERSGSWKGGCLGCSYDLRPGETMEQALRRMEAERKF